MANEEHLKVFFAGVDANLLMRTGEFLSDRLNPSRVVVVTHPSIRRLFGEKIESSLAAGGHSPEFIEVPEGEASKSLQQKFRETAPKRLKNGLFQDLWKSL